jgi:beta-aspartyl-peptidase (threonine type)
VIVMDLQGQPRFAMTSSGMYRGAVSAGAPAAVAIYGDEALRP